MASQFTLGQRVRDEDGHAATVRYIGSVASAKDQKAVYIGVEWDDVTRGKHNGSAVGADGVLVRHFVCADGAGSFLKPKKIRRGETYGEVVRRRYVEMEAEMVSKDNKLDMDVASVRTWSGRELPIEFHGEMKIRSMQQVQDQEKVTVRDEMISFAGNDAAEATPKINFLDIQGNLMWDWAQLSSLGEQLPNLEVLRMNGNRMHMPTLPPQGLSPSATTKLRMLVLNSCGLNSWSQVATLESTLPCLDTLSLAFNDLTDLESVLEGGALSQPSPSATEEGGGVPPPAPTTAEQGVQAEAVAVAVAGAGEVPLPVEVAPAVEEVVNDAKIVDRSRFVAVARFCSLRHLDLSHTGLTSWRQVLRFAWLPSLEQLILTDNSIPEVWPAPDDVVPFFAESGSDGAGVGGTVPPAAPFAKLSTISLSGTSLTSWASIDALDTYCSASAAANVASIQRQGVTYGADSNAAAIAATVSAGATGGAGEGERQDGGEAGAGGGGGAGVPGVVPGLKMLRLGGSVPLLSGLGASETRTIAVARLPALVQLNGSEVRPKERLEAEKTYLRRVLRDITRAKKQAAEAAEAAIVPGGDGADQGAEGSADGGGSASNDIAAAEAAAVDAVVANHPRFGVLFAEHGGSVSASGPAGTGSLAQELITVTLRSMAAGSIEKEPVKKKVPASFQVAKVKQLCKRLFDLDTELQVLYYESGDKQSGVVPNYLDDDESSLGFFGVQDGAVIYMNERDVAGEERTKEAWAQEQRAREEEQERRVKSFKALQVAERGAELDGLAAAAASS